MTGRKTDCTPEVIATIAKNIAMGLSNRDAMAVAGVSESAFYNWIQRGEQEIRRVAEAPTRRKVKDKELPFVDFVEAIKKAEPQRKQVLISIIQKSARGGAQHTETKEKYEAGNETPTEKTITTKTRPSEWQAAAWLLERLHPEEFGRRQTIDLNVLHKEILEIWNTGTITPQDIIDEFGTDIAQQFFEQAGIYFAGVRAPQTESTETEAVQTDG
ncbi:MAG: hypothetical protein AAF485_14400 [Chloroflexota bacterium]